MSWLLRFARRTPIAKAEGGIAVIEGRVVPSEKLIPITGSDTRCVFLDVSFENFQTGSRGRGRAMWVPQEASEQIVGFFVEDDSGRVFVQADRATTEVRGGRRERGTTGKKATSRYVARYLAPGDVVRVKGEVAPTPKRSLGDRVVRAAKGGRMIVLFRRAGG
jgi:hypothetical protein